MSSSPVFFTWASWRFVAPRLRGFVSEFDVPYATAVGITLVIVVAYTALGGFVSVVRTDVVQGVMMLIGAVTNFYFVTDAAGGVTRLPELKADPDTAPLFEYGALVPVAVIVGMSLSGALKLMVDPRQLSRFYALRDEEQIRVGIWVAVIGIAIIQFCLFPIGVYAHFLLHGVTDTDRIVPTLINDPTIFAGPVAHFLVVRWKDRCAGRTHHRSGSRATPWSGLP